jgi:hypothetical protein
MRDGFVLLKDLIQRYKRVAVDLKQVREAATGNGGTTLDNAKRCNNVWDDQDNSKWRAQRTLIFSYAQVPSCNDPNAVTCAQLHAE